MESTNDSLHTRVVDKFSVLALKQPEDRAQKTAVKNEKIVSIMEDPTKVPLVKLVAFLLMTIAAKNGYLKNTNAVKHVVNQEGTSYKCQKVLWKNHMPKIT